MQQPATAVFNRQPTILWIIAGVIIIIGSLAAVSIYYLGFYPTLASAAHKKSITAADFGNAFGGIVGTAFTIAGLAFLAYAYLDQQRQAELALFNKLYDDLIEDINNIQYRKHTRATLFRPANSELFQGVDALYNYASGTDTDGKPSTVLNHLNLIIISFENLIRYINQSRHQHDGFAGIMKGKIYFLYLSKINWPCYHIYLNERRKLLRGDWANARMMFYKYERLTLEAYDYLKDKKLISEENHSNDTRFIDRAAFKKASSWENRWAQSDMEPDSQLEAWLLSRMGESHQNIVDRLMARFNGYPYIRIRNLVAVIRKYRPDFIARLSGEFVNLEAAIFKHRQQKK